MAFVAFDVIANALFATDDNNLPFTFSSPSFLIAIPSIRDLIIKPDDYAENNYWSCEGKQVYNYYLL